MSLLTPPKLVASTGETYNCRIGGRQGAVGGGRESNLFRSAQWSPDGTCILTSSEDNELRTWIVPADLLEPSESPKQLEPFSSIRTAEPVYAAAIYPYMQLSTPSTCCFIASSRDHPIQLYDMLTPTTRASYPLIDPMTEKYHTPASLLFAPSNPNRFIAGTTSQISFFDIHRNGEGPAIALKTIPTRRSVQTGHTMKGIISALAVCPGNSDGTGVLAAGTFGRQVGLYSAEGTGETIGVFGLGGGDGAGVTQLVWSQCERYLYIAERKSEVISVYDIRVAGEKVESFRGRRAGTNQRVGIDVAYALRGEVVGGGIDGKVRIWEAGHSREDSHIGTAHCEWHAHNDVVSSAVVHPGGAVLATCSGSRKPEALGEDEGEGEEGNGWDNSLKIWALSPLSHDQEDTGDKEYNTADRYDKEKDETIGVAIGQKGTEGTCI
ncbi:WD40 repeat-like protein [Morchella conica CCBAS932]|uniref:WD40 repeat-like protein n=1 Tax=Morchella conica CCBAS932 TaxID=1392247 RepID=A0A3N4L1W3_9PEZI|nr:WD40 repeat-like protein [Morchella conica CCBAS932]